MNAAYRKINNRRRFIARITKVMRNRDVRAKLKVEMAKAAKSI